MDYDEKRESIIFMKVPKGWSFLIKKHKAGPNGDWVQVAIPSPGMVFRITKK